jgi:methylmalonyl-CoA mutase
MDDLPLAAEFPPAAREDWLRRVEAVLKGADFGKKLVTRSQDGLRIEPLYEKAAGATPRLLRAGAAAKPWMVVQRVDHPEPAAANKLALEDLENGAGGLSIVFAGAPSARGFGLDARTLDDLDHALAGVMLDIVSLRIETAPFLGRMVAALIAALVERRGLTPAALDIDFGLDPVGDIARTGGASLPWLALSVRAAEVATALAERGFTRSLLRVDTRGIHEAGGSEAQELAAALSTGVAYLRLLEAKGWTLDAARNAISFLMVADADEFLTIAKFRAFRRLWARVKEVCGLVPKAARLQAETAWRMTTRRDPWVNMLRGTIAAFSAGLGGADSVTALPFTAALGLPDAFARRIARNTQLILLEESNLWRVADPAAGSGGFEALTEALCKKAWALFQELEREGGIVASLQAGALQARIAAVREGYRAAARSDHRHERFSAPRRDARLRAGCGLSGARPPPLRAACGVLGSRSGSWQWAGACRRPLRDGCAQGRAPALAPRRGAFRAPSRPLRRAACPDRRSPAHLPCQSRPDRGLHAARDVRQECLRGGRHRGARQ